MPLGRMNERVNYEQMQISVMVILFFCDKLYENKIKSQLFIYTCMYKTKSASVYLDDTVKVT